MVIDTTTVEGLLCIGLIVSAFMAIDLEDAIYSVIALAATLILLAFMYAIYGAIYAAIFQIAVGVSTLAVLFLSGEMLSELKTKKQSAKRILLSAIIGVIIALPTMFFTVSVTATNTSSLPFQTDLWDLRSIDVVLQGLVILVIAIGIAIVLHEKKEKDKGDE